MMAENKIPEIEKMLGVEHSKRFTVKRHNEIIECRFLAYGLDILSDNYENPYVELAPFLLVDLINGTAEVVK